MSVPGWLQSAFFGVMIAVSTVVLGRYMYRVYFASTAPGDAVFGPVERRIYRLCGIDPTGEQRWSTYAGSLLIFSLVGVVVSYFLLRMQAHLPLNPDHFGGIRPALSFNTAVSFLTGTNWQSYAGESTMSQLSQMLALVVQQFVAGAVGMAVAVAFTRALIRRHQTTLGS